MLDALTLERERTAVVEIPSSPPRAPERPSSLLSTTASVRAQHGSDLSLLFVAHREEILDQSMATFRAVLHDGSFGEKHGGGHIADGRHVFAMVQSLHHSQLERIAPNAFDVVIVDEFHTPRQARMSRS